MSEDRWQRALNEADEAGWLQAQSDVQALVGWVLSSRWYTVDPPWGDGTYIIAGDADPHVGVFVCDCDAIWFDDDYDAKDVRTKARTLARHIVEVHNAAISG